MAGIAIATVVFLWYYSSVCLGVLYSISLLFKSVSNEKHTAGFFSFLFLNLKWKTFSCPQGCFPIIPSSTMSQDLVKNTEKLKSGEYV